MPVAQHAHIPLPLPQQAQNYVPSQAAQGAQGSRSCRCQQREVPREVAPRPGQASKTYTQRPVPTSDLIGLSYANRIVKFPYIRSQGHGGTRHPNIPRRAERPRHFALCLRPFHPRNFPICHFTHPFPFTNDHHPRLVSFHVLSFPLIIDPQQRQSPTTFLCMLSFPRLRCRPFSLIFGYLRIPVAFFSVRSSSSCIIFTASLRFTHCPFCT